MTEPQPQSPLREILKTSVPAVIDLSSQTITWLIEAIFIGHLSAAALAGVGISLQIVLLTFAVVLTFVMGSSIIILRYLGAKDSWNANHVLAQALMMGTIMSVFIGLIWYFAGTQIMLLIREEAPVARHFGVQWLQTVSYFAPIFIVNFIALGILRMAGDTMVTMRISIITNAIHLLLLPLLVFGYFGFPRLEAVGAALSIGIAHTIGFTFTFYYLRSRKCSLFLSFREYTTPNFKTFKQLFKLGVPTTVEQLVWAFGQLVLSSFAAQMGIVPLAVHQVFLRIQSVLSMAFQGFGLASMTLVGKNLGAEKEKRAMQTGRIAGRIALIASLFVATLIFIFHRIILVAFTSDPEVVAFGSRIILVLAIVQIPKALNIVFSGNLRGGDDLAWLMWLAIFSVILFESFGAYFLSFILGAGFVGLWIIQAVDESIRFTLNYFRFRGKKWKIIETHLN
ncbi:MAG TPA: MATE family efflux transporter [Caldithrix sp.]|nr:MATE family efflux transporter [Caldithrix sp.]